MLSVKRPRSLPPLLPAAVAVVRLPPAVRKPTRHGQHAIVCVGVAVTVGALVDVDQLTRVENPVRRGQRVGRLANRMSPGLQVAVTLALCAPARLITDVVPVVWEVETGRPSGRRAARLGSAERRRVLSQQDKMRHAHRVVRRITTAVYLVPFRVLRAVLALGYQIVVRDVLVRKLLAVEAASLRVLARGTVQRSVGLAPVVLA